MIEVKYPVSAWEKQLPLGAEIEAIRFEKDTTRDINVVTNAVGYITITLQGKWQGMTSIKNVKKRVKWDSQGRCISGTRNKRLREYDIKLGEL